MVVTFIPGRRKKKRGPETEFDEATREAFMSSPLLPLPRLSKRLKPRRSKVFLHFIDPDSEKAGFRLQARLEGFARDEWIKAVSGYCKCFETSALFDEFFFCLGMPFAVLKGSRFSNP